MRMAFALHIEEPDPSVLLAFLLTPPDSDRLSLGLRTDTDGAT